MRTTILILATLALATVPLPAQAAPTCDSLERAVPLAGNAVTVRTDSCHDLVLGGTYTYERWWNVTTFRTTDAALGSSTLVSAYSQHEVYVQGADRYEYWGHSYSVQARDADNPVYRDSAVGLGNQQGQSGGQCGETTSVGLGAYGPAGYTGFTEALYGGSAAPSILPCTSSDVQHALP